MEVERSPKKSKFYGEILTAGGDLEIVHWLNEPTTWITAEHTGADVKGYWQKWNEESRLLQSCMQAVEEQMGGDISFKTFKWTMRQLKDHVLIMRAICNCAGNEAKALRSRKIMHAPAEKFYSRCAVGFSAIVFLCGIGTGILELLDSSPSWLALFLFVLSSLSTYVGSWFAERWGVRERKLRKLQKIVEQRGVISSARVMIDAMDFDEETIIAIMKQRTHIENNYPEEHQGSELSSLGRAVAKMERKETLRNGVVLTRGTTTVKLSADAVSRRRHIEKMLATEDLDQLSESPRKHRRRVKKLRSQRPELFEEN
jgi:hypothetical protein